MNCSRNDSSIINVLLQHVDSAEHQGFSIPILPSRFLLVTRFVIACCGILANSVVLLIFAQCRRLHYPRHTCWMAVSVAALFVHLLALIEMVSGVYPTRPAYNFLVFFKGSPFVFFSLGYSLVALERFLAVSHYMWHKEHVTNRVVVMAFSSVGIIVIVGLVMTNCLGRNVFYFMPGSTDITSWKIMLLAATVVVASIIGIILQILTYRQVQQVYKTHPTLRREDRYLFIYRPPQSVTKSQLKISVTLNDITCHHSVVRSITSTSSSIANTTPESNGAFRASRLDLEAGFYYFVISIPVLISNGLMGLILACNVICSHTDMASDCQRWITISFYIRTIQLFIAACNPIAYFALSSEFRSACRSRFTISRNSMVLAQ